MTRGTIISGLYGHRTGVTFVGGVLPTDTVTLFDRLSAETPYAAALFGKYHVGTTIQHPTDIGITTFKGFLGGAISDYYNWTALDVNGPAVQWSTYSTTAITNFGVDYINEQEAAHPDQPWFLYQAYNGSHSPFQVPPTELHSQNIAGAPGTIDNSIPNYKAIVQATDTEIGRLLAEVDLDVTTVIFIGDNGTPGGQKDTGTGVRGSKSSAFEGGVRVPFVIAGAGVTRRGREHAIVNTADLYATILELTGLTIGHVNNSYSLKPLLTDATASSGRTINFTEICSNATSQHYAIRDARYKLVSTNKQYTLYDLVNDPLEATDLYNNPEYAAQRASLLAEIETLKASATAGCFQ
jgi:arylsulfatase A-like enzyme